MMMMMMRNFQKSLRWLVYDLSLFPMNVDVGFRAAMLYNILKSKLN